MRIAINGLSFCWLAHVDVPEMPANVTVKEVSASTVLLSADSPPLKPVSQHGGLDVISWMVTYQAESREGRPLGREFRTAFANGKHGRESLFCLSIRVCVKF